MSKIWEKLFYRKCNHENVATTANLSYCPDCGKLIKINWYVIRCKCCNKKRIGLIRNDIVYPIARYCTNCGSNEFFTEKIDKLTYFDINYAVAKKEVEEDLQVINKTQIWVDDKDIEEIILRLKLLPQFF